VQCRGLFYEVPPYLRRQRVRLRYALLDATRVCVLDGETAIPLHPVRPVDNAYRSRAPAAPAVSGDTPKTGFNAAELILARAAGRGSQGGRAPVRFRRGAVSLGDSNPPAVRKQRSFAVRPDLAKVLKGKGGNSQGPLNCPSSCHGVRDMRGLRGDRRCDYRDPIRNVNVLLRDLRRLGSRSSVDKNVFRSAWQALASPMAAALRFFRMLTDELRTNIIN
jgi:hypothetical protein